MKFNLSSEIEFYFTMALIDRNTKTYKRNLLT